MPQRYTPGASLGTREFQRHGVPQELAYLYDTLVTLQGGPGRERLAPRIARAVALELTQPALGVAGDAARCAAMPPTVLCTAAR